MNPCIANFLLLVISSHKSIVGAREASQWACPRFISVVCGFKGTVDEVMVRTIFLYESGNEF